MTTAYNATPRNFMDALDILNGRSQVKIGHNTYMRIEYFEQPDVEIKIRLHNTDVVTFTENDDIILDDGGWQTVTTKERINRYLPSGWKLYQKDFQWFIDTDYGTHKYYEGISLAY
tara:strand:+ start:649 stop:996 length:348 start_codon:yes stop_codon:yes gene_type:complete